MARGPCPLLPTLSILLVAVVFHAPARAQDAGPHHSLVPGAWALGFRVGEDFQLQSLEGSLLTIKKHTSADVAWRLGLSFDLRDTEQDFRSEYPAGTSWSTTESDIFEAGVQVALARLHYPRVGREVIFYWAVGPEITWRRGKIETEYANDFEPQPDPGPSEEFMRLDLFVSGEAGAEWFMTRSLSLHAGYSATGGYRSTTQETESTSPTVDREENGWLFGGSGARLGLSVYL